MNPLLYGHNPKQRVVAVHQLNDRFIRLYSRIEGKIQQEDAEFFPFFFLSDASLLDNFPRQFWLKQLEGDLSYRFIAAFSRWGEMWEAVHHAIHTYSTRTKTKITHYNELDAIVLRPDPVFQFLAQSGITLFKGMEFDELYRMQIDLQGTSPAASGKGSPGNRTISRIVLSDTMGWYDVIGEDGAKPGEMLHALVSIIQEKDPDIIEGHNLYGFILPTLVSLADQNAVECTLGRDGSNLKHVSAGQPFQSADGDSGFYEVAGRHLVDTQRLAEIHDSSVHAFDNFTLDYLAQYFGIDSALSPNVVQSSSSEGSKARPQKTKLPPLDNVQRVRRLSEYLSLSYFYLAQMCPLNFARLLRIGSAARIESLLLREYLKAKHSLPRPERGSQSRGGYTDIFYVGVFSNILHADVESLYPSIMVSQKIKPQSDRLDVFVPLLRELTAMRLRAKRELRRNTTPQGKARYDALQSAFKVLINSFYGYLAYARALFNDYEQADRVTTLGQTYLRTIIDQARLFNAQVVEVDTDGLFFIPPDNVGGIEQEEAFVKRLASTLPEGINLLPAGRYKKMLSYKKKNYALMDYSDQVIIRGSSLISRSLELFARRYIEQCVECILMGDIERLHRTFNSLHRRIVAHQWSAREFCRSEVIKEDLDSYEEALKKGDHPPSPPIEAAKRASLYPTPGLTILYYVTGSDQNVRIADNCRVTEEWDSNIPDENTPYYLSRLTECSAKFRDFFSPGDYERVFSTEDLFGFSPEGITIVNHELKAQKPDSRDSEPDDEFPIWLGDQSA
jgi:DNA polymerase I